jgi:pimeloyl-ACP methyl ester carboxylesterase
MPDKHILVFLHGYANDRSLFNSLLPHLQPQYNHISLNLKTISSPDQELTLTQLSNHVTNSLKRLPYTHIHLIGFSLGGLVATKVAHQLPKKVSSLLLLNISPKPVIPPFYKPFFSIKNPFILQLFSNFKFKTSYNPRHTSRIGHILTLQNILQEVTTTNHLLKKYQSLKIKKRIILFKDDQLLDYKQNHHFLTQEGISVKSIHSGGHTSKKNYWPTIAREISTFLRTSPQL